jgi:hypothetical protein
MMNKVLMFFYGVAVAVGIVLVLGAAGSDCDGKCMENAMPLVDVIKFSVAGLALIALGALGFSKVEK